MQLCEQFLSCARKIARKVATKNPNSAVLDFHCIVGIVLIRLQAILACEKLHVIQVAVIFIA